MLTEALLEGLGCGSRAPFIKVPQTAALGDWHLSCQLLLWNPPRTPSGWPCSLPSYTSPSGLPLCPASPITPQPLSELLPED